MRVFSIFFAALIAGLQAERTYGQLSLNVNRSTGAVELVNSPLFSAGPISFDAYLIKSGSGSLNPNGWFSLQDQGISNWFRAGTPSATLIAEAQLVGSTGLALGQSLSIGSPYNLFPGIQDLEFEYTAVGGSVLSGPVLYVGDPFPPPGLLGDFNFDGIVSHADYSVLGDQFGQTYNLADFDIYRANYGNVAAAASAGSVGLPTGSLSFSAIPSATAEGNTQWLLSFAGVQSSLAGHLNIQASGANVLSATGGASFLDNNIPPVGVPGHPVTGGVAEGIIVNGTRVFAALGSTLGAPSPGPNREFLTLVTEGSQSTTLTIQGQYGYQGLDYSLSGSVSFGPGSSPSDPLLPNATSPGEFIFSDVPSGKWIDPPLVDRFEYVMDSASLFTAILDFPPGFAAEFAVTAENSLLGEFGPGDSVDFVALLGHGVESFIVSNITPLADAADPNAFPLKIEFNTPTASFRMLSVPEPASAALVVGLLSGLLLGRVRPVCCMRSESRACPA